MLNKIVDFIEQNHLLDPRGSYLVALSGGADSIALALAMKRLHFTIEAVHCNFQLRGAESQRDEDFVKAFCLRQDIPLHLVHFDTKSYAHLHKVSIEMAARQLRYAHFEALRRDLQADEILVAHHRDDSIETMLMNLLRGTGIHGLTGIRPRNGHVVRPLLCVSRKEIEDWLQQQDEAYVTDSTNLVADVQRNKIRLLLLPLLKDIVPQASENLFHSMWLLAEATKVYDAKIEETKSEVIFDNRIRMIDLLKLPSPLCLLFEWLAQYGFSSSVISQIATRMDTLSTGSVWTSPTHELCYDRGQLILQPIMPERPTLRIPETGIYRYDEDARIRVSTKNEAIVSRNPWVASLDADRVRFPLTVRAARPGDRFVPFGMKGSKLLSDFLTDRRLSVFDKHRQLIVTDASDNIVWVVGQRTDQHFSITTATITTLLLSYEREN